MKFPYAWFSRSGLHSWTALVITVSIGQFSSDAMTHVLQIQTLPRISSGIRLMSSAGIFV